MDFYEAQEQFMTGMMRLRYEGDLPLECYVSLIPIAQAFSIVDKNLSNELGHVNRVTLDNLTVQTVIEKTLNGIYSTYGQEWDDQDKFTYDKFVYQQYSPVIFPASIHFDSRKILELRELKIKFPFLSHFQDEVLYLGLISPYEYARHIFLNSEGQIKGMSGIEREKLCGFIDQSLR